MCGIFGAVSFGRMFEAHDYDAFVRQTDLVSYRGPDASGYTAFSSHTASTAGQGPFDIFLGHRRLSIIDLSDAGIQPMTDGKGLWIIFNGEIFNYVELREELRRRGHEFRTATDTEVILKTYELYGEAGFEQLNGMWAFVLVDLPRRKVVLSRDRFAIKPLYYTRQGDRLYFGSEIKQLLPFLSKRAVNRTTMYKFLVQAVADHSQETFFEEVQTVQPKHNLVLDLTRLAVSEKQYWDYHSVPQTSADDAMQQFRDLLIDSIKIRLRSDVPVGALVSGGLDSSAIAVVSYQLLGVKLKTFSVVAENEAYSEGRFVDILVRGGMENRRLTLDSNRSLDALDDVIYHNDEPFLGFHAVAQYQLLQKIHQETDITVILSGQGGDEALLGYTKFFFFYLQELLKTARLIPAAQLFFLSLVKGTTLRQFRWRDAKRYLPGRKLVPVPAFIRLKREDESIGLGDGIALRQKLDIDRYSVPVQTHFEDRNSMAHSLEMRTPFLDHRLLELSLSLPASLKLHDGWSKYVLRQSLPELPAEIRWRRDKQGFLTPEERWVRNELRPSIQNMFRGSVLQELGVVDDRRFLEYYDSFLAGSSMIPYNEISRLFLAEKWARRFLN